MRHVRLDPSPRSYAPTVTLVRRSAGSADGLPTALSPDDVETWLLGDALLENDILALFEALCWRLAVAGLGVDRASLHTGTLDPQVIGYGWNWSRLDGFCDEIRVAPEAVDHDSYRQTPLRRVIEGGERFRASLADPATLSTYPFLRDLSAQGLTDYVAVPIGEGRGRHEAMTAATLRPGGFAPEALGTLARLTRIFALHVARHIALRVSADVVRTYLGEEPGRRILDGSIRRGTGVSGEAVIWMSDMRGFTELSERLEPAAMLALLDAYFEVMAGAVQEAGGEVLKFIGDGLLAGFGGPDLGGREGEAKAALAAARSALAGIERLNAEPPEALAAVDGWRPLRTGIALHRGEVFFGNVGAPDRLDFTVIGRAVNVASRVEALCKPLDRPLLLTADVAALVGEALDDLGTHTLKGVVEPVRVFAADTHS